MDTAAKILKAAEDEFMEKGYGNARMMSIAARAGVSHSMLHYYYRSKEDLFQKVFESKAGIIIHILEGIHGQGMSFEETVKSFIENKFDVIRANSWFCSFMLNDVLRNKENLRRIIQMMVPRLTGHYEWFSKMLNEEIAAGRVRRITVRDLVLNIVFTNVAAFITMPIINELMPDTDIDDYLDERKKSNVDFILAALRP